MQADNDRSVKDLTCKYQTYTYISQTADEQRKKNGIYEGKISQQEIKDYQGV